MNSRHLIHSAEFHVGFDCQETAFALQAELNGFVHQQMMKVVEEVFDAAAGKDAVLRIPAIELDLGVVPHHDYRDELPRRLRRKLEEALAALRQSVDDGPSTGVQALDRRTGRRELLEYYLVYGHLPWYAGPADGERLAQHLSDYLRTQAQAFKSFLQQAAQRELVVDRLVTQFPTHTVYTLIELLAPAQAGHIIQLVDTLLSAVGPDVSRHDAQRLLVGELIMLLLGKGGRQLDVQQLLVQALLPVWRRWPLQTSTWLERLARGRAAQGGAQLQAVLSRVLAESAPQPNKVAAADDVDRHASSRLADAICAGDFSLIEALWQTVLTDSAGLLEQVLNQHGRRAVVRKRLAHGFPESALQQILALMQPTEHGFVATVLEQPVWFRQSRGEPAPPRRAVKRQLWEFTLTYLLVERGSRFNKKSYLASVLRQAAAANNLSPDELAAEFSAQLRGLAKSNAGARQMLHLLTELDTAAHADARDPGSTNEAWLADYTHYDQLIRALSRDDKQHGEALNEAIDALERRAPHLLMRLLRELQAGAVGSELSSDAWSTSALRSLVLAFVRLMHQGDGANESPLIEALESYAARSPARRPYYYQVLRQIVRGELIDFEAIPAHTSGVSSQVEHAPLHAAPTPHAESAPDRFEDQEQVVSTYLRSHKQPTQVEVDALVQSCEYLLERQPRAVRRLLNTLMSDARMTERLVRVLPERLSIRWLGAAGVNDLSRLIRYADIVTTACYGSGVGVDSARLAVLKWQAVFAYVAEFGPVFQQRYFVTHLVHYLMQRAAGNAPGEFVAAISQQLLADSLPSTREMIRRTIQCLNDIDSGPAFTKGENPRVINEVDVSSAPEPPVLEDIYIYNAGVVLAAPYLPRVFDMLGLTKASAFRDRHAAVRGVHMLQFLVNGNLAAPEYQLVLNKLLCGVKTGIPIEREITLAERETEQLLGLLQGMIQNWTALGNTSVAGLREAFLQREGRLQLKDDAWHLLVESKPYDMLLDQLPWSYSTIKYAWMERVIYVDWR